MRKMSQALVLAGVVSLPALLAAPSAGAAETAAASPYSITTNINLVTEYRFRGIDQTWGKPALQGGVDYSHTAGWYAGAWGSNVSGGVYPGGSLELDYYAGYNGKISEDLGWTAGGYGYYYPGANTNKAATPGADQKLDNFELNAGLSWKWISYKLSYSTTDYFGANTNTGYTSGTKGTLYHDLSLNYPIMDDLTLGFHAGRTDVKGMLASGVNPDYSDYKLSLAKTFKNGWNVSAAYVKASNDNVYKNVQSLSTTATDTRDLNKAVLVLQAGRTF